MRIKADVNAYVFDLDETLLYNKENRWLPGAKEFVMDAIKAEKTIIFITGRNKTDNREYNIENTKEFFRKEGMGNMPLIFNVKSPRAIVDNIPPVAVHRDGAIFKVLGGSK